ncbi:unnamed protein product [Arctia plantaginis]|uniref:Chitin-binding type-2 domain-containing protein n=1 Tax=Arctia plantaginis TaxID=874455 RepID=A0A8S1BEW7_ARCPL|nr:unnamed protein product [Arctia plantaginis]
MWSLVIFLCLTITWAEAQNGRGPQYQDHNGHGWDIRLAVPGEPGNDYPTLGAIPRTDFSCAGKEPGYYADIETNCQVFRVCTVGSTYGFQSFLCPNGTLFNQAVFVCDWWMNVNCKTSQQLINNNNEKFGNLRLGPQLMKDIKKMLTHPMRNSYDKSIMKSNLIVMQDYKPPTGQLFPNGALLAGPERPPNNVYVPSKQIQQNFIQSNPTEYTFSASTPEPQYVSAPTNTNFPSIQKDESFVQKQQQSGQYIRTGRVQSLQNSQHSSNLISNSHAGQFLPNSNSNFNNNNAFGEFSQVTRPTQVTTFTQRKTNTVLPTTTSSTQNNQRNLANRQRSQFSESKRTAQATDGKHSDIGDTFTESRNNKNFPPGLPKFSNEIKNGKAGRELKDNLVSTIANISTTAITKAFSRFIQETKSGNPKSRATNKTWIMKPTKAGRQLTDPTPYTYERPSLPIETPTEIFVDNTTPYSYDMPTFSLSVENAKSTELESEEPYVYPSPTTAAKQISTESEFTRLYNAPAVNPTQPTISEHLNVPSPSPLPTKSSRYYLPPAPFQATQRLYLPPKDSTTLSRQYLSPNAVPQPVYYQNAQLRVSPSFTSPMNILSSGHLNQPSFTLKKDSRVNINNNNLTLADILTKQKLDITVNDIVKDTDSILKTVSPLEYNQYRKSFIKSLDPYQNEYISLRKPTDSGEKIMNQSPLQTTTVFSKSSRLIATPAISLLPPDESYIYQNINPLSNLAYYKESAFPNTIERTVSIKITIPEKIAMYLFKNQSDAEFDKLDILNTGSSNYLVLSNNNDNLLTKKNIFNFIPITKLPEINNSQTISDSQALVYSFLTDSINIAREHRHIAQQEVLSSTVTPTPAHFQSLNNQQLSDITNKISQLTSSQFSSNLKYSNEHQARQLQNPQFNGYPSRNTQNDLYSSRFQRPNTQQNIEQNVLNNQNEIYSGQLYRWPVPERNTNQNNAGSNLKQTTPAVEIIKAETINLNPAKLQLEPSYESNQITNTENLTNLRDSENGISAKIQDMIVGTIPHPIENNKVVTYKTDRSYYLYTKPEDNRIENFNTITQTNTNTPKDAQLMQSSKTPDSETFQLIPSVNYELEDVEEQQQILDAFQIDEFGAPRDIIKQKITAGKTNQNEVTSSVEHDTSTMRSDIGKTDSPYSVPSSYTAPQSSVGSLEKRQNIQNHFNSKLEDFDNNNSNGYPKERPARQFVF